MPGIVVDGGTPQLLWIENSDARMYVTAVIGELPASTVVAFGSAGVVEYVNGGPRFRLDDAMVAAPHHVFPGVAAGGGKKGDLVRVQVYGAAKATFLNQLDTTVNKILKAAAANVTVEAAATDKLVWGVVTGAGANSKTQQVVLAGVAMG